MTFREGVNDFVTIRFTKLNDDKWSTKMLNVNYRPSKKFKTLLTLLYHTNLFSIINKFNLI